jgi:hypothetical protein
MLFVILCALCEAVVMPVGATLNTTLSLLGERLTVVQLSIVQPREQAAFGVRHARLCSFLRLIAETTCLPLLFNATDQM